MRERNLQRLFDPQSIAVVGASDNEESVGYVLLRNLVAGGFGGDVYPVSLSGRTVQGMPAYSSMQQIRKTIDLAVIAVPAKTVPQIVRECGEAGVGGVVIVSAGFRETGEAGARLEEEVRLIAERHNVRVLGPNCMGFIRPASRLNVTFARVSPQPGRVAFFSQSGALGTAILDWATANEVGFSAFVSVGSTVDIDFADLIDFFGDDARTTSIILYIESIEDARAFMGAARRFARSKPIIAVKSGRTERGALAAASHTGAIAGDDALYGAMFRRAGVVRVNEIDDLFNAGEALSLSSRPRGPRLGIVTNAGGPGVMACDRLLDLGGQLSELTPETDAKLKALLPEFSSRRNPVDVLGDADAAHYAAAAQALMDDPNCDGVLAILVPQVMTDAAATARALVDVSRTHQLKPLLASFMGEVEVAKGLKILQRAHVPTFDTPEHAVRAYMYMYEYTRNLANLYDTPAEILPDFHPDRDTVAGVFAKVTNAGRSTLTEAEAKAVLSAYQIPVNRTMVATSAEECAKAALKIGFPVAVKVLSNDITYKSDVGGVALDVRSAGEAAEQFVTVTDNARKALPTATIIGVTVQAMIHGGHETIVGARKDPTFGPAVMFGTGGTDVELQRDVTIDYPPLNEALARAMIERTRVSRLLKGYRGSATVDMLALERTLVKVSSLLIDFPQILEMDVNPLKASADGVCAVNARITVESATAGKTGKVPGAHLMIPIYPTRYHWDVRLAGERIHIRAIKPEDEPLWTDMVRSFSHVTAEHRFFGSVGRITKTMLMRYCHIDYDQEIALVAIAQDEGGSETSMLGVARLTLDAPDAEGGEFGIVVRDEYQGKGLGHTLMEALIQASRERQVREIDGYVLAGNRGMLRFVERFGFAVLPTEDPDVRKVVLRL